MAKVILQPIGNSNSIEDFKKNNSERWAEKLKYKNLWEESEGAIVLFTHDAVVFAKATISSIENSGDLKYPLDYYYDDIEFINIPFSKIRDIANFSEPYRNFTVLNQEQSQKILDHFESSELDIYKRDEDYQRDIDSAKLLDIKDEPETPNESKEEKGKRYY